ncbi:MAG: hypothetical protein N3A63_07895 [Bacteroidetes bacterium]|nr:hypothetical protein [Bacteroidota bacterium]
MKRTILSMLSICAVVLGYGQEGNPFVSLRTSATLTSNFYSASGIEARQPRSLQYGIIRSTVSLYEIVELPFELYFSTKQAQFQQPFNQFGVSPRISNWLTLHAGYFSTRISDFTFGDLRVLGAGFEIAPADFRIKAFYGRTRKAVQPDRVSFAPEVYKQTAYALSFGYGNLSDTYVNVNLFHAIDDSLSVTTDSATVHPQENLVGSIDFGARFGEIVTLDGEVGVSLFSSNTKADTIDAGINVPSFLFHPNASTCIDGAAKLNVSVTPSRYWSVTLSTRWVGPGFTTLGYALMPNDLLEISISPRARFFDNQLSLRSKVGVRYNNLRQTRTTTTRRWTGMLGASWQVSHALGIDASYNRNQISSQHKNDTLRLSNVFDAFTLSPRITFDAFSGSNTVLVTYSYQNSSDKNVYTTALSDSRTHSINATYILLFPTTLSLTTTVLYNKAIMSSSTASIIHVSEAVGKQFLENRVTTSFSLGVNFISAVQKSSQIVFRVNAGYTFGNYGTVACYLTNNSFRGDGVIQKNYNELYGNVQYSINL